MKKGEMSLALIIGLTILVITIVVIGGVFKVATQNLNRAENVNAVRTWVLLQSQTQKVSTEDAGTQRPPFPDLGAPIVIENEEQLKKAQKQIADAIYDCWTAFDKGETDFLKAVKEAHFCYPCVAIMIDDSLKNKENKLLGMQSYLANTKVRTGLNAPTYLEYLTGEKNLPVGVRDEFAVNNDMYVFFVASAGRSTWELLKTGLLGYDAEDSAVEDAMHAQLNVALTGTGLYAVHKKANAFLELQKLQQDPAYQSLKGEVDNLRTQVNDLNGQVEKLTAEGKDVSNVLEQQKAAVKKLGTSQIKVSDLENIVVNNAKEVALDTADNIPKELLEELDYTRNEVAKIESRIANADEIQKIALREQADIYKIRLASVEKNIIRASSKGAIEVGEKAVLVASEEIAESAGKVSGVTKVGRKLVKSTLAKTAVKFVPLVGQAVFVGDMAYTSYKIFFGDRLYSATIVIDEPAALSKICNPIIERVETVDLEAKSEDLLRREILGFSSSSVSEGSSAGTAFNKMVK